MLPTRPLRRCHLVHSPLHLPEIPNSSRRLLYRFPTGSSHLRGLMTRRVNLLPHCCCRGRPYHLQDHPGHPTHHLTWYVGLTSRLGPCTCVTIQPDPRLRATCQHARHVRVVHEPATEVVASWVVYDIPRCVQTSPAPVLTLAV
jgi:hypothetical protein